ncbi:unnamed protein product [Dovyalis caffra]|uniref:Disease resistance N-terminal domain-containing protein n=1 Tax=Dovyalis caffra TaxID=77055 RepID=A0AAV1QQM6_9ROSI|nr:unnamed protein product [Dovyalis caffra]
MVLEEVTLLKGIHEEVVVIKDDLEAIKAFLKDADSKAEKEGINESVKVWVKQAREVAYQIEDVIDEYMLHVAQHHERRGCERSGAFQFISSDQEASSNARRAILHDPGMGSLFIKEGELVGIESSRDELTSYLIDGASQRTVISLVGMGVWVKPLLLKKYTKAEENWGIADFCKRYSLVYVHPLEPLSQEDSWELFCKKTFKRDFEGRCPKDLEKLSRDIVGRCGGLPLAIVAIGGLLACKEKMVLK